MLKFFRQKMTLQFGWLKIFYTLCFRINITGRKTLKNNYLQWELQLLVPYFVRRNQGRSLFCQWLYSALHWQVMPLVPPVKQNCNGAPLRTFQHLGMAVIKWEFCFLSWKPGMQQKGVNNVYPPLKDAPRRCEGEEGKGIWGPDTKFFHHPTGHQTFFTQTVTLICQKNWEKWSTMVERITKMPQAKSFKDLLITVQTNMGWDGRVSALIAEAETPTQIQTPNDAIHAAAAP